MVAKSYGRSLIELISISFILSIVAMIALPNLQDLSNKNARTQTVNQMMSLLHHGRSSAVFSRRIVSLCHGAKSCSGSTRWDNSLLIFVDKNANGQRDAEDELLLHADIADQFSWHWNRTKGYVQFEADGTTRAMNGTLTLCRRGIPEHQVVISLAGRIRSQQPGRTARC